MKTRQTGEKRRKEMQRLERQRDKADRRKLRKQERATGEGSDQLAGGEVSATGDGPLEPGSLEALAADPLRPLMDSAQHPLASHASAAHAAGPSAEKLPP